MPFFTSDQLPEYRQALLHAYGMWYQPPRQGNRGRYPKPLLMPPPELLYAQVVKTRDHSRIVQVDRRVVFGDPQAIAEKLTSLPTSATINTSFVERHNLTQRQSNRRFNKRHGTPDADHPLCHALCCVSHSPLCHIATIDGHGVPGDKRGSIRAEPDDRFGNLLGFAQPCSCSP